MDKFLFLLPGVGSYANVGATSNYDTDRQNKKRLNNNFPQQGGKPTSDMGEPPAYSEEFINDLLFSNVQKESKNVHLKSIIKKQEARLKQLEERNDLLQKQNGLLQKRSCDITKDMAKVMERRGNFENVNDEMAITNITETFSNVYSSQWVKLSRWLAKQFPEISELKLIQSLTSLMKKSYRECICLADEQLRQFMLLDAFETIPSKEQHQELYALRTQYAQTENARSKIRQAVVENVFIGEEIPWFQIEDKTEEAKKMLQEFLHKYVDCCWVMVVSNPRLALNFDVVGKQYCKEHFKVYSAKERITDETKVTECVFEVVWPCVYFADGSAFCTKGDALLVSKGSTPVVDSGNVDCTCFVSKEDKGNRTADDENSSVNKKVTDV